MKFKVHMIAFSSERGIVREVDVPDDEYVEADGITEQILELIFKYGQNDFQPKKCYSVSMGDVVELDGEYYVVAMAGFKKISKKLFNSIECPPEPFYWNN